MGEQTASGRDHPASGRDRDAGGRAQSKRPRDALGRPLTRDAAGVAPMPETAGSAEASLALAQRLLDAQRPFQAHEVLEEQWKRSAAAERGFWQALAQLAVAVTHAARGNPVGAVTLLHRCAGGLAPYVDGQLHAVPSAQLRDWALQQALQLAERDRGQAVWLQPPRLQLPPRQPHVQAPRSGVPQ